MIPPVFIYSHDSVFQGVKQEASIYAKNKIDKDGASLFEQLVFDEAYLTKFRELFFDAQAEIHPTLAAYMKNIPNDSEYFERQDFSKNRDYTFVLEMGENFNHHLIRTVEIRIHQFLIAYIMYRWLETKSTQDAAIFAERAENTKKEIKEILSKKIKMRRRKHGYY